MAQKKLDSAGFRLPKSQRPQLDPKTIEDFAEAGTEKARKLQDVQSGSPAAPQAGEAAESQGREAASLQVARSSSKAAGSQARKGAASRARRKGSDRRRGASRPPSKSAKKTSGADTAAIARTRSGTGDTPYTRADGKTTRSTTVHFEVDLHQALRIHALKENRTMSEVVSAAVHAYLLDQD